MSHAGRNITTVAVALVCDHLLQSLRLHRVELAIRPENVASICAWPRSSASSKRECVVGTCTSPVRGAIT